MAFWYKNHEDIIVLRVRTNPNSSSLRIVEVGEEALKIAVCAVPEKGKANEELIKFLSKIFKLPKKNFEIIKGLSDKNKQIAIFGLTEEKLLGALNDN